MHLLLSSSVHRKNLELTCGSLSRLGGLATKVRQLAPFSGSPRTQRSPSASDGKLGGVWERVYCSHEFVLLTAVTKQRDPDSGQHSLFFQVSRELNNGGTSSLIPGFTCSLILRQILWSGYWTIRRLSIVSYRGHFSYKQPQYEAIVKSNM